MKAVIVGVDRGDGELEATFHELSRLCRTLDISETEPALFKLRQETRQTLLGPGQFDRLLAFVKELEPVDFVVFNEDLKPLQYNTISDKLEEIALLDRTQLILEIFARHAKTSEGKLQIELARLKYSLPRLMGMGKVMSRLGGGIGSRGPGETALEVQRRAVRARVTRLENQIGEMKRHRALLRDARKETPLPVVAIVGYTNAGKSTLLNRIARSAITAEDKLFSTLDPTTRLVTLGNRQRALFSDTVGFIQKLPTHLIHAFRSTLEEATYADLLLHVVDMADDHAMAQHATVEKLLEELGAGAIPRILALNKCDRLAGPPRTLDVAHEQARISAATGDGIPELLALVEKRVCAFRRTYDLRIPRDADAAFKTIYAQGEILERVEEDGHVRMQVRIDKRFEGTIREYVVEKESE